MNNSQKVKGNKNKVINKQIQFFNHNQEPDITAYDRTPVTILNKQVKTVWILIGAVVSFAANAVTIYTSLKNFNLYTTHTAFSIFVLGFLSILLFTFHQLLSKENLFKFKGLSIANYNGSLFFEKYKGTCPCGGKLKFFQNLQTGQGYSQCLANDQHLFNFSPKTFNKENYATV